MQILSWQTLLTIAHLYLVTGFKDMYNDQKYRLANDLEYISDDRYSPSKINLKVSNSKPVQDGGRYHIETSPLIFI